MSGRFFLDTNAVIELLKGNSEVVEIIASAEFIACSVISELEYISFSDISENDILLFSKFLSRIEVVDLKHGDILVKDYISQIRKTRKVKLPDAIILASAKAHDCTLVTADKRLQSLSQFAGIQPFNPIIHE